MFRPQFREEIKRWGYLIVFLYLVLLLVSHFYIHDKGEPDPRESTSRKSIKVEGQDFAYLEWGGANKKLAPLILIHGTPGMGARDWEKFAPEIAATGRRVVAVDRYGYGASQRKVDDYSFFANRLAILELMNHLKIKRAHLAGWSYGGGAVLLMGEMDHERILSVSLIAALGIQKGQGSGSFLIEHTKYSIFTSLAKYGPELVPHFGALGNRSARFAMTRDLSDIDQRNMEARLTTLEKPLLIMHGKNDRRVGAWVAQEHHRLQPQSRLVLLESSHFFPYLPAAPAFGIARDELVEFLAAAEEGKASRLYGKRNETTRTDMRALWDGGIPLRGYKPWFFVVIAGLVLGFFMPRTGGLLFGFAGGLLVIDLATGITGIVLGAMISRGESRTRYHKAAGVVLLGIMGFVIALLLFNHF